MLIPDPRGLFIQAFVGVAFFNDNYFYPWFIFCLIHYTIVWETSPANQMPPVMMWEFLVRMAFIFIWGSLAGLGVAAAMRTRALVPSHTFHAGWPRLGVWFATFGLIEGTRAVMTLIGVRWAHEDFGPDPSLTETRVLWIFLLILYVAFLAAPIVVTLVKYDKKNILQWINITYRDGYLNVLSVDYIVALILVLAPQALWDFLVLAPANWGQLSAGALTLIVELIAWVAIYFWFVRFRNINETHFSREHSMVCFGEFVLIVGGLQVLSGIVYMIAAEFLNTMIEAEQVLASFMAFSLVVAIALFFLLNKRRRGDIKIGQKGPSDDVRLLDRRVSGRQDRGVVALGFDEG